MVFQVDCGGEIVRVNGEVGMGEEEGFVRSIQSFGFFFFFGVWGGVYDTQWCLFKGECYCGVYSRMLCWG